MTDEYDVRLDAKTEDEELGIGRVRISTATAAEISGLPSLESFSWVWDEPAICGQVLDFVRM